MTKRPKLRSDGRPPLVLRSQREIGLMRQAGLVVWKAHQAAAQCVRPGATTADLDGAIERVFEEHRAEPLFKGVPGKVPFPAVACVSVNEEVVHGIPGDRELCEGDIVSVDTGCRLRGWCGDAAVTHAVGQIMPDVQRLLDATRETLELAIRLMGEKRYWSEVAEQMAALVRKRGFSVVESFTGHGIGRSLHEPPSVPNYKTRHDDFELRPGLVVAIEPMVNMGDKQVRCRPDGWTQVTADGLPSAHFEHTIALTREGPQILTGSPETGEAAAK